MAKKEAEELFGLIEKFAGYGFNKSHSTAYALIAYMTAYLKAHYPVEFMAALLSSDIPGPQLQTQGFAGRTSGRLPADERHRAAAGREPLGGRVHRVGRQDLLRPVGHQGLRRRSGGGHRQGARRPRPVSQPLRLLRTARSGHRQSHGHRIADQGRRVRLARRQAVATLRGHRPGIAGRRVGGLRPAQRADGPLRRR